MRKVMVIVVVLAVIAGIVYSQRSEALTAKVTSVEGEATVVVNGAEQPATVGMAVPQGATIRTAAGGQVDVCLKEEVAVRVQGNGEAVLTQNSRNRITGTNQIDINLKQGELLNRVDNLPSGSAYSVRTSSAVCGVRGTRFGVSASGDGTEIGVMDGSVVVKFGDQERTLTNDQIMSIYRGREATDIKKMSERQRSRLKPCGLLNFKEVVNATRAMVDLHNSNIIVQDIMAYFAENGRYPATLAEVYPVEKKDQFGHAYIYRLENGKFFLASMGEDGIPGTGDDIVMTQ